MEHEGLVSQLNSANESNDGFRISGNFCSNDRATIFRAERAAKDKLSAPVCIQLQKSLVPLSELAWL